MPDFSTTVKIAIEQSTDRDLRAILYWLKKEYEANGSEDGFWNNRRLIREGHHEGRLVVLREDDKTVAFLHEHKAEGAPPVSSRTLEATVDRNNRIQLPERVVGIQFDHRRLVVKIQIDGETIYFGKARDAKAIGIQRYWKAVYPAYYCD